MSENKPVSDHAADVSETVTQTPQTSQAPQALQAQRAQAMLLQRRQVLKAAALAAPLRVTLRARSVYAGGGGGHSQLGSTGINYGPGSYGVDDDDTEVHEPGKKKKKKKWGWWW